MAAAIAITIGEPSNPGSDAGVFSGNHLITIDRPKSGKNPG
jgi:hypothetical protein